MYWPPLSFSSFSIAAKLALEVHRSQRDDWPVCDNANFLARYDTKRRKPFAVQPDARHNALAFTVRLTHSRYKLETVSIRIFLFTASPRNDSVVGARPHTLTPVSALVRVTVPLWWQGVCAGVAYYYKGSKNFLSNSERTTPPFADPHRLTCLPKICLDKRLKLVTHARDGRAVARN
jgi:hypothetical protein